MRESKVEENLENDETDSEHGNFDFRLQLDLLHLRQRHYALLFYSSERMICQSYCIVLPDNQTVVFTFLTYSSTDP